MLGGRCCFLTKRQFLLVHALSKVSTFVLTTVVQTATRTDRDFSSHPFSPFHAQVHILSLSLSLSYISVLTYACVCICITVSLALSVQPMIHHELVGASSTRGARIHTTHNTHAYTYAYIYIYTRDIVHGALNTVGTRSHVRTHARRYAARTCTTDTTRRRRRRRTLREQDAHCARHTAHSWDA